jgi:hypothetical protein
MTAHQLWRPPREQDCVVLEHWNGDTDLVTRAPSEALQRSCCRERR